MINIHEKKSSLIFTDKMMSRNLSNPGKECQVHCYPHHINIAQFAIVNTLQRSADGGVVGGYSSPSMRLSGSQTSQNQDPKSQTSAPQQLGPGGSIGYQPQGGRPRYYQSVPRGMPQPRHPQNVPVQLSHGGQNPGMYNMHTQPQLLYNPSLGNIVVRIQNHSQSSQQFSHPQVPLAYAQPPYVYPGYSDFQRTYVQGGVPPSSNASHAPPQAPSQHGSIVSGAGNGPNGLGNMQGLPLAPQVPGNMLPSLPAMQHMTTVAPGIPGGLSGQPHLPSHQMPVGPPSGAPPPASQKKPKTRPNAIKILDPDSGVDVVEKMLQENSQSGDSSTSHTPQPQASADFTRIQTEFASKVAAVAHDENGNNSSSNNRVAETTGPPQSTPSVQQKPHPQPQQPLPEMKDSREPLESSTVVAPPSPPTSPLDTPPVAASLPTSQPPPPSSSIPFQNQVPASIEEKVNGPTILTSNEIQETEVPKPKVEPPPPTQAPQPTREVPTVSAKKLYPATTTVPKQPHSSSIGHAASQQPTSTPPSSSVPSVTATSAAPSQRKPQLSSVSADFKPTKQDKKQPQPYQPKESRGPFPPPSSSRPGPGLTPPPIQKVVLGPPPGLVAASMPSSQQTVSLPQVTSTAATPEVTSSSEINFREMISLIPSSAPPMPQLQRTVPVSSSAAPAEETNGETDSHESSSAQGVMPRRRSRSGKRGNNWRSSSVPRQSQPEVNGIPAENNQNIVNDVCDDEVGKASQRQPKGGKKKKDLNRKGQEKEGTEMDAFTDSMETSTTAASVTAGSGATCVTSATTTTSSAPVNKQPAPSVKAATTAVTTSNNARVASPPPSLPQPTPVSATVPEIKNSKADAISKSEETVKPAGDSVPSTINNNIDAESVPAENDEYAKVNAAGVESNNNLSNEIIDSLSSPTSDSNNNGREENGEVNDHETEDSERTSSVTIEKSISKPALKLNYKEGQWSPFNPDGKRVYDRSFLLEVKHSSELASKKPSIHPDVEILKDKPNDITTSNRRSYQSNSMGGRNENFGGYRSPVQRGPSMGTKGNRPSSQLSRMSGSTGGPMSGGPRGMGGKGPGHQYSSSMNTYPPSKEEVLHTDENRWNPHWKGSDVTKSKEELKTESLLKKVRGILNKLTPQKFDILLKQFMDLPIDNGDRLEQTVILVLSKAVDEPSFAVEYANLCCELQKKEAPAPIKKTDEDGSAEATKGGASEASKSTSFRKLLLLQCQAQFERNEKEELNIESRLKEIESCTDPEKKKELKLAFEEEERKIRRKSVGLVRFIGELYKLRMLTSGIMHNCIQTLLQKIDEESLECLCKLLTTVGKMLEESEVPVTYGTPVPKKGSVMLDEYFARMKELSQKSEKSEVSSRIRFMLQDVIELRHRRWVPRRDENAPKTLDQIQKDAERERELSDRQLMNPMPNSSMGNQGMRGKQQMGDDRRRGGQKNENDWTTIGGAKSRNYSMNVDSSKLSGIRSDMQMSDMQLGKTDAFKNWSGGAGGAVAGSRAGSTLAPNLVVPRTANKYDALAQLGTIGGRKFGSSSTSMEKERALSLVKEVFSGTDRRGGGASGAMPSRPGSGPPSRESSRPRYGESSPAGSMGGDRSFPSSLGGGATTTSSSFSSSLSAVKGSLASSAANTPSSGSPTPVSAPSPALSEDECDRRAKTILEEWCQNLASEKETLETLKDRFGTNVAAFVRSCLNAIIEKPKSQAPFSKLLVTMVRGNIVAVEDVVNEYAAIMKIAYDLIVDIPLLWNYLCTLIAPVIAADVFTFAHVSQMCQSIEKEDLSKLLVLIFQALKKDKMSSKWKRSRWDASGLTIQDIVPKGVDVDAFLKEKELEFLVGEVADDESASGESCEAAVGSKTTPAGSESSSALTPLKIEDNLVSILQAGGKNSYEVAAAWIKNNLSDKQGTKDSDFIKTLTRAVLKVAASGEQLSPKFKNLSKLLRMYIDNDEACELACLQAITRLMVVESCGSSIVIKELFSQLLETGTISKNGFLKWQQVSEKEEGAGVMMKTLTAFFVELSEEGCDDSSDES